MILESKFHGEHAGIIYFSIRNFDLWFWGYFRDFVKPKFLKNVYLKKYALLFSTDSRNGSEIKFHYRKISSQIHFILIFKVIRRKMKVPISVLFNLNFLKKKNCRGWLVIFNVEFGADHEITCYYSCKYVLKFLLLFFGWCLFSKFYRVNFVKSSLPRAVKRRDFYQ